MSRFEFMLLSCAAMPVHWGPWPWVGIVPWPWRRWVSAFVVRNWTMSLVSVMSTSWRWARASSTFASPSFLLYRQATTTTSSIATTLAFFGFLSSLLLFSRPFLEFFLTFLFFFVFACFCFSRVHVSDTCGTLPFILFTRISGCEPTTQILFRNTYHFLEQFTHSTAAKASASASFTFLISAILSASVGFESRLYQWMSLFFCHLPVGAFILWPR